MLAFSELLPALRVERQLLTSDISTMSVEEVRRAALIAWGDARVAGEFAAQVYRSRLEAAGGE
jgi:hypothetical protein